MKIVVAISGASGVVLGGRLLKNLQDHHTYVIVSDAAKKIAVLEGVDMEEINALAENIYREDDIAADIGSSSGLLIEKVQNAYNCNVVGFEPGAAYREYTQSKGFRIINI